MTSLTFDETGGIGLSARLWKNMPFPYGPGFIRTQSGNPGIGHFDEFLKGSDTSLEDGYILLQTATGTVLQITSEDSAYGIRRLTSAADNDEAVIQLGNGLDVGAFIMSKDFTFEARVRVNAAAIVAGDHGFFVGMATGGASGTAIANQLFTTGDAIYATANLIGFQHLVAESTALDAMYQTSGQTKVDGAVNTDLDTVHTLVAATWVKLGFRVTRTRPRRLEYYVNGVKVASIGETAIAAAAFPDAATAFMQPTIGMRGVDSTTATLDIDWIACAQLL
jgi:hypothetical protein